MRGSLFERQFSTVRRCASCLLHARLGKECFFMRGSDSSVLSRLLDALKAVQQHVASARKAYSSMRSFTAIVLKQQIS